MQRAQDFEGETEGQVAGGGEAGGGRGRGGVGVGVQVGAVGADEVAPKVFRLGQVKRVGGLRFGERDRPPEEEVEGVGRVVGGGGLCRWRRCLCRRWRGGSGARG